MSKHSTSAWGDRPRAFFKSAFILYLATVTGCANTTQDLAQPPKAVDQTHSVNDRTNLPELGSPHSVPAVDADATPSKLPASTLLTSSDDLLRSSQRGQGSTEFQDLALGQLASATAQSVKDWFSARHATAELQLAAGRGGTKTGSFDLLMPLHDTAKDLFFTQIGVRRSDAHTEDYRTTVNLGVGYRKTLNTWLVGANTFYDRDLTGKNDRLGIGAEAMTDYLKLSANGYLRLSDWKRSPDLDDYLERPANGFDLRAEAYLPSYPQLGGKLMFEQYYGDQVGLFGASDRQKDPSAVTVGVTYTPVPMIGLSLDHRQGQGGLADNTFRLAINYQFDVSLAQQLSTASVSRHRLANARYDLVSRNNEIVLEYKKAEHALITLPAQVSGSPSEVLDFPVTVSGGRLNNIQWTGSASVFAQPYQSASGRLVLPGQTAGLSTYTLQAYGSDAYGQRVVSNIMQVVLQPLSIEVQSSKPTATADGQDALEFTATLRNSAGAVQTNASISWSVQGSATVTSQDTQTNSVGQARLRLVSRLATSVQVQAHDSSGAQAQAAAAFVATTAGRVDVASTPASITANGTDASTIVATVRDSNGQAIGAGTRVTLTTSTSSLSASTAITDAQGQASVTLTGTAAGSATITATAGTLTGTTTVDLVAAAPMVTSINLVATPTSITANGTDASTLVATVRDANGQPIGAGTRVTWTTSTGTLSTSAGTTDAQGQVSTSLTGTSAGSAAVNATAGSASARTTVTLNVATTYHIDAVYAVPRSVPADGESMVIAYAQVVDQDDNPAPAGISVTWSTTLGQLSAQSSTTNAEGQASTQITSEEPGRAQVEAATSTSTSNESTSVTFTSGVEIN
jgi:adhesin/invasin